MVISSFTQKLPFVALGTLSLGLGSVFMDFHPAQAAAVRPGFNSNTLARNDDGSTVLVPIGFDIDFLA